MTEKARGDAVSVAEDGEYSLQPDEA